MRQHQKNNKILLYKKTNITQLAEHDKVNIQPKCFPVIEEERTGVKKKP
jgi:hypothetical protein